MPNEASASNKFVNFSNKQCRACPNKHPVSEERFITRCIKCNIPFHTSCAKRKLKSGLCSDCIASVNSATMALDSAAASKESDDLKSFITSSLMETKTEITGKIDQLGASLKQDIAKVGKEVAILRKDHDALRLDHDVLKMAHNELQEAHEELKTGHLMIKGIVTNEQTKDPVRESILEITERAIKQRNSIVYGVPEDGESTRKQANSPHDMKFIKNILASLSPDLALLPFTTFRIGKAKEEHITASAPRPRPLKVCFPTPMDGLMFRNLFITQKKAAPNSPQLAPLNIVSDRTQRQRDEYKRAKERLTRRLGMGETGLIIAYIVVIKKQNKLSPLSSTFTPSNGIPGSTAATSTPNNNRIVRDNSKM